MQQDPGIPHKAGKGHGINQKMLRHQPEDGAGEMAGSSGCSQEVGRQMHPKQTRTALLELWWDLRAFQPEYNRRKLHGGKKYQQNPPQTNGAHFYR